MEEQRPATPDLILASASPRRRELLQRLGLSLRVAPADIDESPRPQERADEYVRRMAAEKAAAGVRAWMQIDGGPGGPVTLADGGGPAGDEPSAAAVSLPFPLLAADTTVIVDGAILGKPGDEDEARAMLLRLAGRRHEVTTAYRIVYGGRDTDRSVTTVVAMRLIDPREVDAYVAGGEWRGKAGGYAVQGIAAAFVTELRGSWTNVVGLPLAEVLADLRALGALARYPPTRFISEGG